jgi:hypothetical protein
LLRIICRLFRCDPNSGEGLASADYTDEFLNELRVAPDFKRRDAVPLQTMPLPKCVDIEQRGKAMFEAASSLAGQTIAAESELEGLRP